MGQYILALDEGTTGSTALVMDVDLKILSKVNIEFAQHFPQPGWVEHDAEEIWNVTVMALRQAIEKAKIKPAEIAAIGITNQRETVVMWDSENSQPIHPAIVWQDRRTADFCDRLRKNKSLALKIRKKTGLVLDPYFSGSKIKWLMENVPLSTELSKKQRLRLGTMDSWLVWKLTSGHAHVTDVSNASRTMLFDIQSLNWDKELIKIFRAPFSALPKIVSCSEVVGTTRGVPGLPDGIPIAGMAGDQQAALFGQMCFRPGDAKCTYGTGSFLLMNIGKKTLVSKSGLVTTVAWKIGNEVNYAFEGSNFIAGAAVQWLRDGLHLIGRSSDIEDLAASVPGSEGVYFVPALAGLGAPYWNAYARGVLSGLTRGSTKAHVARAVLEGIAFSQCDILTAMQKDSGRKLRSLRVDGGASTNNLMMQFQADVLGCRIVRPKTIESTALGAALLAGLAVKVWPSRDYVEKVFAVDREFSPIINLKQRQKLLLGWQTAIRRANIT